MNSIRQYQVPLQKYVAMMDLQVGISTHLSYIANVSMRLVLVCFVLLSMLLFMLSCLQSIVVYHCKYKIVVSFFHDLFSFVGSSLNCFLIELYHFK